MMLVHVAKYYKTVITDALITRMEGAMDTHFIFGLVLVAFAFWLCFKFRKDNKE